MRVFIALGFEDDLKSYLQEKQNEFRIYCNRGNFTDKENFHLTIKFIGEVNKEKIEEIKDAIDKAANDSYEFFLNLNSLGSFERQGEHIPWIGLGGDLSKLNSLYNNVQLELDKIGIVKEDRALKPHITLGRRVVLKDCFSNIKNKISVEKLNMPVTSLILMESTRINGKLTYIPIYKKKLSHKEGFYVL